MSEPKLTKPLSPEDAVLLAEIDSLPLEQRDRLLGTLSSLLFATANGDEKSLQTILGQLRANDDLDLERINLMRIAASVRLAQFGIDQHLGPSIQLEDSATIVDKLSKNAEIEIIASMEELVSKLSETEDQDKQETIILLIIELTDYARHLDVSRKSWLRICELQEPYEQITSRTFVAKLPPKGLWPEFGIAA